MALPCTAYADETYQTCIALCYGGDAYSADYVFGVPEGANISSVMISDTNCIYDWNYNQDEARLYISLASGNVIAKAKTIAAIVTDKEISLTLVALKINGKTQENAFVEHTEADMDDILPGFDTPGKTGGKKCSNCGIVLTEPVPVSPTGPKVDAVLDSNGTLTVFGGLSDSPTAEGTTFAVVYNKDRSLLYAKDISGLDQSDFSISIGNMKNAYTVKIFRWTLSNLQPLHDAVEVSVKTEL